MIVYSPLDGHPITHAINVKSKHCFLMTRLGKPIPPKVAEMRKAIAKSCKPYGYKVIDAQAKVTGRDFLLKIWRLIAATPVSIGIVHEDIPDSTQANIYYELGVAQALGKETVIVKSPKGRIPSDFSRTEYIVFDGDFEENFDAYLQSIYEQADYYEVVADQLDRNPVLALDYLKREYLINGNNVLREKADSILESAGLEERAANSVELLAATF